MKTIKEYVDKFYNDLLIIDANLQSFKKDKIRDEAEILSLLSIEIPKNSDSSRGFQIITDKISNKINLLVSKLRHECEEKSQVSSKLDEYAQKLLIVVYGSTNTGKSSLGNFIRGQSFLNAPFNNPYKGNSDGSSLKFSKIHSIEKSNVDENIGKSTGDESDWFEKGITETTREAHLFDGPGIAWLDTPGFGSVNEQLGDLAKKYVEHADLVVFLENSDCPGLRQNLKIMLKQTKYCKFLIVISRSDRNQNIKINGIIKKDAQGKPIRELVNKEPGDRRDQENYVISEIKKHSKCMNINIDCSNVEIMSMSTLCASEAIINSDDEKFFNSNVCKFFDAITQVGISQDEIIKLKSDEVNKNIKNLIDSVLNSEDLNLNLILSDVSKNIDYFKSKICEFDIESIALSIKSNVMTNIFPKIDSKLDNIVNSKMDNIIINFSDINSLVLKLINDQITSKCLLLLDDIYKEIDNTFNTMSIIGNTEINRVKDEQSFQVAKPEIRRRAPSGILEHLSSFFLGTEYTRLETKYETKTLEFDRGFDVMSVKKNLIDEISAKTLNISIEYLTKIKKGSLIDCIELLNEIEYQIKCSIDKLNNRSAEL
jgi:predicted GTPase